MCFYDSDMGELMGPGGKGAFQNGYASKVVFVVPENTSYVEYGYRVDDTTPGEKDVTLYPMVTEGEEAVPYEPYPMV